MALRHILLRLSPRLDRRWLIGLLVLGAVALGVRYVQWDGPAPPLDLVALGPEGGFGDTLRVPTDWGDTATTTPGAVTRVPLILGVRNRGTRAVQPARLALSLPVRYRLTGSGGQPLDVDIQPGSPLATYLLETDTGPIEPGRLPALLARHDTLWLEVVIPSFYCVAVGDSIPEFVPAPPPPVASLSDVRIFYSFEGGDLSERRTGTLAVRIDSSLLRVEIPATPPTFAMQNDPVAAQPALGSLQLVGSRRTMCGEPEAPMELLSTVWETPDGGRFITLDYGGRVRKRLYDLDGDGVIDRESWDPSGQGAFTATRRARLPIPEFLLPVVGSGRYDMARLDSLSADSLARLDPFREAMPGPGPLPAAADSGPGRPRLPPAESLPEPVIDRGLLGQPVTAPPPPDTGGG
jgi:hypothetical protein